MRAVSCTDFLCTRNRTHRDASTGPIILKRNSENSDVLDLNSQMASRRLTTIVVVGALALAALCAVLVEEKQSREGGWVVLDNGIGEKINCKSGVWGLVVGEAWHMGRRLLVEVSNLLHK